MTKPTWKACLAFAMIVGGVSAASAGSNYDGSWSVSIRSSKCEAATSFALRVENGRINQAGGNSVVSGQVDSRGYIRVNIKSAGHGASGSGHLSANSGTGTWRGQRSAVLCSGSWEATRL